MAGRESRFVLLLWYVQNIVQCSLARKKSVEEVRVKARLGVGLWEGLPKWQWRRTTAGPHSMRGSLPGRLVRDNCVEDVF